MSKLQGHTLLTLAATTLAIFTVTPLLSSVAATNFLVTQSSIHNFLTPITGGQPYYKQILQLTQTSDFQYTKALVEDSLLDMALKTSAVKLAESYQSVKQLLDFLPLAEHGVIIQTPTQKIGPDNAREVRPELEKKLSIYETAIRQRGYKIIAGKYHAEATSSCDRIQSMWAGGVRRGFLRDLNISQDNFKFEIVHPLKSEGKIYTLKLPGAVVESVLIFNDPMNSDFEFIGEIMEKKIIVCPDVDRVLSAWPNWVEAPSRKDLSSCNVTLISQ